MSQRKRKQINIEEKSRIISKLVSGIPNKNLAVEYGVPHSTISNIWREREKILTLYDNNFLKLKRARTTKHTRIEEALVKWIQYQRTNNVPINGPILQQKANDFAQCFGEDFVCSSSWIQRFRARHGIVGKKRSKEAACVDQDAEEEWITIDVDVSNTICAQDEDNDIAQEIKEEDNEQLDSEEQFFVPTLKHGLNAITILRRIVLFNEQLHIQGNYDHTLIKLQRELQNMYERQECSKQTEVTDSMHTDK